MEYGIVEMIQNESAGQVVRVVQQRRLMHKKKRKRQRRNQQDEENNPQGVARLPGPQFHRCAEYTEEGLT